MMVGDMRPRAQHAGVPLFVSRPAPPALITLAA